MTDRPIPFKAPMIRALLDGRKTQTRRVLKVKPGTTVQDIVRDGERRPTEYGTGHSAARHQVQEPIIAPGDRLWVREAWSATFWTPEDIDGPPREFWETPLAERTADLCADRYYRCDEEQKGYFSFIPEGQWTSPIHMPRWASRLTLLVTDVRVQRLQDISEADAVAEGIEHSKDQPGDVSPGWRNYCDPRWRFSLPTPKGSFSTLWNSINGNGLDAWALNPWVAAISFEVVKGNIDQVRP